MATIKSYTDLEQSKVLTKFLPIESADAFYLLGDEPVDIVVIFGFVTHKHLKEQVALKRAVPCWSLAALLEILDYPQLSKDKLGSGKIGWMVSVYPNNCRYDSCWHDNPVDACYEMILKLHELNLL